MPKGKWTAKEERMYQHILKTCRKKRRRSAKTCKRIAAATVNKHRKFRSRVRYVAQRRRRRVQRVGVCDCEK